VPKAKTSPEPGFAGVLADVSTQFKLNIGPLSTVAEKVCGLPTGNLTIDYLTGVGGLPLGRSTELFGQPSSGKTTTALQTAAALQQQITGHRLDSRILYLDFEHALDPDYSAALGLDVEHPSFLLAQPGNLEQGCEAALKLIDTGIIRLVIFDSVASMAPISRIEGEFDQRTAAMNKARLMSGLMLQLTPLLHHHDCAAVFINHLYQQIDMTGRPGIPPTEDTPGGRGLKFYSSLRLRFAQLKVIHGRADDVITNEVDDRAPIGIVTRVKVVKNKVGKSAGREADVRITTGRGFDNTWSALKILCAHRKVQPNGSWYYFDKDPILTGEDMTRSNTGRPCLQGEHAVLEYAANHPQWNDALVALARSTIAADGLPERNEPDGVPSLIDDDA